MTELVTDALEFKGDKCRTCPGAATVLASLVTGFEHADDDRERVVFNDSLIDAQRAVDWCQGDSGPECALRIPLPRTLVEQPLVS